jgi:hypothetical protein
MCSIYIYIYIYEFIFIVQLNIDIKIKNEESNKECLLMSGPCISQINILNWV